MSEEISLARYMIVIDGPPEMGRGTQLFETDEYGRGSVSVYKVLEGGVPSFGQVGHVVYAGGFQLKSKGNKTLPEFMEEIKEGLAKIVSSGK